MSTTDFIASTFGMITQGRGVRFNSLGDAADVYDLDAFKAALRKWFGHENPSSFYRSCSNYGIFRSSNSPRATISTRGCTTLSHQHLRAGRPDLLHRIQRVTSTSRSTASSPRSGAHARTSPRPSPRGDRPRATTREGVSWEGRDATPRNSPRAGGADGFATAPESSALEEALATIELPQEESESIPLPAAEEQPRSSPTASSFLVCELPQLALGQSNEDDVPPPPCPTDEGVWLGAGRTPWPPTAESNS